MNITAIVGVGIIGTILAITVKNVKPELGIGVSIITGIAILSLVLPEVAGILQEIKLLSESSGVDFSYFEPVIKIIGICYITQTENFCFEGAASLYAFSSSFIWSSIDLA